MRSVKKHAGFLLRSEEGNILVLAAVSLSLILGLLAFAVDSGRLLYAKRQLQTLADAAAMAGALELSTCGTTSNCAAMQGAAKASLTENSISTYSFTTQCATSSGTGYVLTLNNGPCALGSKDPNNANSSFVEAVVTAPVNTIFLSALGKASMKVQARAEAGGTKSKYCMYVLGSGSQTLLENGSATLKASCGIIVNSSASTAAIFNGSDVITTTALDIVGGDINNGSNTISPAPNTGATAVADPLSGLAAPTGSCGSSTSSPYSGATNQVIVNGGVNAVFNPGVYCGGIIINGSANATFNGSTTTPYIIKNGMIVNGGDTITGTGVTFYIQSGQFIMNGSSHAVLSAPTTGAYAGILYYQSSTDSSQVIINGDTTSKWEGTIYAPGAQFLLNGGSNVAAYTNLVVQSFLQNGNVNFTLGSDYSSLPGGNPLKGNSKVFMVE